VTSARASAATWALTPAGGAWRWPRIIPAADAAEELQKKLRLKQRRILTPPRLALPARQWGRHATSGPGGPSARCSSSQLLRFVFALLVVPVSIVARISSVRYR